MKTLQDEGKTYRDETVKAVIITTETTNAGTDEDWSQADKIDYIDEIYEKNIGWPRRGRELYMNRNCFTLTKDELWFLVMSQNKSYLTGCDEIPLDWNKDEMENCFFKLKQKKYYIIDKSGNISIDPLLNSWMYVVTHPQGYCKAENQNAKGERILLYFYGESIVSIHMKDEICELIWLPFIHLAIGQFSAIIKKEHYRHWRFSAQYNDSNLIHEYIPSETEDFVDVVNHFSKIFISVYGEVMKQMVEEGKVM